MILVFGKNGQVARELSTFENVQPLDRQQADLTNPLECVEAILNYNPKAVINAAAYTAVDNAESYECLARQVNGEAPAMMAKACAKLEIPLVHISTDYVFDGSGETPWHRTAKPNPKNAYGRSKLEGEKAIVASGCIYAILRTSWIFSAHGNNFVKTMLRLSKNSISLPVVNDQIGGPTCARNLAQTCLTIADHLRKNPRNSGTYHYSGHPDVSWCQFANAIFEEIDSKTIANPISTSDYPTPAIRPLNSRLDCKVTKDIFGIDQPSWHQGLKQTLRELVDRHDRT